jgi:hypothetical protein
VTALQARLATALHRLTDLPLKDCQAFLAEDGWDIKRAVARMHAYRWLSGWRRRRGSGSDKICETAASPTSATRGDRTLLLHPPPRDGQLGRRTITLSVCTSAPRRNSCAPTSAKPNLP